MRGKWVFGIGLVGVMGAPALAQFASDRMPATPGQPPTVAPFGGAQPGAGGVPPVGGFQPATPSGATAPVQITPEDLPTALGPNHPLAIRPEHGAYFLCLKSYSRPGRPDPNDPGYTARELSEALVAEVRRIRATPQGTSGLPRTADVFLYEYISEERKAEAQARARARQQKQEFEERLGGLKKQSELQNREFLPADNKLRYQTFKYRDQVAVLFGGFQSEDEAVKALAAVKKWPPPQDKRLMDGAAGVNTNINKPLVEGAFINPFTQAMVVRNPYAPKVAEVAGIDPLILKLNDGRPYNLLKAQKAWTLGVKTFTAPVTIQSGDKEQGGIMRKMGLTHSGNALTAGAAQAETLAKALRSLKGPSRESLNLEAFVLHARTGSIVTVGQFDAPNDPALIQTQRLLSSIKFHVSRDEGGVQAVTNMPSVIGTDDQKHGWSFVPVPVPKP